MIGTWKNIQELEESLSLEELELIVKSARDREHRLMKFYAAFKGVDLDEEDQQEIKDRFDRAQRRAEARLSGKTDSEVDTAEEAAAWADLGIEVETE